MESLWTAGVKMPQFPRLHGDIKTDVLIIGGGMAGLLCGYLLKEAGISCALAEQGRICQGVTQNTTAKITFQHGAVYDGLIRRFGLEKAEMYLKANQLALEKYRELCQKFPCGFEEKDAFLYSCQDIRKLEKELDAYEKLHCPAEYTAKLPLPFPTAGAVRIPKQGQFHPLLFFSQLAARLPVYENTAVKKLSRGRADTGHGTIKAETIIVATHFPFLNRHGSYFLKMYQSRSYLLALQNGPDLGGMYLDESPKGMTFRNYGKWLLLGGQSHRTGEKGGGWAALSDFAKRYYPNCREEFRWAAQDCMTLDQVPYIGQYSRHTPGLFVATGFQKWGVTSSMAAAILLRDLIQKGESPFAPVFSPSRTILRPQLAINGLKATANLLTFSKKRCPHLGCALKWNPQEHSWDCPCHGSRFDEKGNLLDNPAMKSLNE